MPIKTICGFMVLLSVLLVSSMPVYAQGRNSPDMIPGIAKLRIQNFYTETVERIYKNGAGTVFDMGQLRSYYPNLEQYAPFFDELKSKMIQLAYTVTNGKDLYEIQAAADEFNRMAHLHFGNPEMLFLLATLTQEDVRLGNHDFYKSARENMYKAMTYTERGGSEKDAFQLVTFGEEDIILRRLGGKLIASQLYDNGTSSFLNVHQIKDLRSGKVRTVYFDLMIPISKVEGDRAAKEELEKKYSGFGR